MARQSIFVFIWTGTRRWSKMIVIRHHTSLILNQALIDTCFLAQVHLSTYFMRINPRKCPCVSPNGVPRYIVYSFRATCSGIQYVIHYYWDSLQIHVRKIHIYITHKDSLQQNGAFIKSNAPLSAFYWMRTNIRGQHSSFSLMYNVYDELCNIFQNDLTLWWTDSILAYSQATGVVSSSQRHKTVG